jgi:hypothetical protein
MQKEQGGKNIMSFDRQVKEREAYRKSEKTLSFRAEMNRIKPKNI